MLHCCHFNVKRKIGGEGGREFSLASSTTCGDKYARFIFFVIVKSKRLNWVHFLGYGKVHETGRSESLRQNLVFKSFSLVSLLAEYKKEFEISKFFYIQDIFPQEKSRKRKIKVEKKCKILNCFL